MDDMLGICTSISFVFVFVFVYHTKLGWCSEEYPSDMMLDIGQWMICWVSGNR